MVTGVQSVRLLLHGGVENRLPELLEGDQFNSHSIDSGSLVRMFLLSSVGSGRIQRRLGVPVQARRLRHSDPEVLGLVVLVHPHADHDWRFTNTGNKRRVGFEF